MFTIVDVDVVPRAGLVVDVQGVTFLRAAERVDFTGF